MSVLLVGLPARVARRLVDHLVAQGDEVRIVEQDQRAAEEWKARGAHPARGAATDADLIERAAQGVRTVIVGDARGAGGPAVVNAAVAGAKLAAARGEGVRLVLLAAHPPRDAVEAVRASGMDYVVLWTTASSQLWPPSARRRLDDVVAALDAADDLSGNPRLELDLRDTGSWRVLGVAR